MSQPLSADYLTCLKKQELKVILPVTFKEELGKELKLSQPRFFFFFSV